MMREGTCYEIQYRHRGGPWQLLCDRDETKEAAEQRIAGLFRRSPKSQTEYRVVKVTREPEVSG
jgi:hypothetical protein